MRNSVKKVPKKILPKTWFIVRHNGKMVASHTLKIVAMDEARRELSIGTQVMITDNKGVIMTHCL